MVYLPAETPSKASRSDSATHYARCELKYAKKMGLDTYSTREVELNTENTNVLGTGELDVGNSGGKRDGHCGLLWKVSWEEEGMNWRWGYIEKLWDETNK